MNLGLSELNCLVTGGSSGIGMSCARLLCAEGANVLVVGRDPGRLAAAVEACGGGPGQVESRSLDLLDSGAPEKAIEAVVDCFGAVDALINCAGNSAVRPLDAPDSEWWGQWELNVMIPRRLMEIAAPEMARRGGGAIVNVCSSAGRRPSSRDAPYAVTKRAELALTEVFAQHFADSGVRINAIAPGPTATELWFADEGLLREVAEENGVAPDQALADIDSALPLGRMATSDEVAAAIVFLLASKGAGGETWSVDGGHVPDIFP